MAVAKRREGLYLVLGLALALSCQRSGSKRSLKSASLTREHNAASEITDLPKPSLRDGVWVFDGDMLARASIHARGVVHYGRAWPGGRVPFRFSSDSDYRGDKASRQRVREAVEIVRERTELDWIELPKNTDIAGGFVEIRFWDKRWGSAQVGYVGEKQVVNLPSMPSLRLTLHELGHVMGLGHEHQHPLRDKFVKVDRSCVPEEHRDSFAPRDKHVVSRIYDIDSIMHYRSSGFCRKDKVDADDDGNTGECAFVDDDPKKGKCYALKRTWGACDRENCEDRDGDGFREYIRGAQTLSDGDVRTIHTLHREMLSPKWPSRSFGNAMIAAAEGGQVKIYVAATEDGPCGTLWELRPNADRSGLVRHRSTPARWGCKADPGARIQLSTTPGSKRGNSELWVGISGEEATAQGGWVEQWRRNDEGEMQNLRTLSAQDWGMPLNSRFGHSVAALDANGDGRADALAIGAPGQGESGRVYYAQGLQVDPEQAPWAQSQGQLAGSAGVGESLAWILDNAEPSLVLGVNCTERDPQDCEASLWRWCNTHHFRKVAGLSDLGAHTSNAPLVSSTSSYGDATGLWWMLPQACARSTQDACGGAWPLRAFGKGLVLDRMPVRVDLQDEFKARPDGLIALASNKDPAILMVSESGQAWVAIAQDRRVRWVKVPVPKGAAPGQRRNYTGWWDHTGLYVVTAWNEMSGQRQLSLERLDLELSSAR